MKTNISHQGVGKDLDDVGVPHPRQQPGLSGLARRNLHDDETVFKVDLLGQEDPGEAAAPELAAKEVRPDFIACVRQILFAGGRLGPAAQQ